MRQRKGMGTVLSAVLSLALLAGCGAQPAATNGGSGAEAGNGEQVAKIGYIGFLSGSGAAYGEAQKQGLELALTELNEANKGKLKIELITEDSGGKKESAINAANKLINQDKVVGIIGPTLSGEMFAIGPVASEAETPILGISNTAEGINDIGEYVFRNSLPESVAIPAAMDVAVKKHGIKTAAFIYAKNDDFSVSGFKTMKATAEKMGLTNLGEETFSNGDVDFAAQLTKIKAANPDALFVSALYKEGSLVVKKAREIGLNVPIIGGNGFNNPQVLEIAGHAAEGLIVATPFSPDKKDENVQNFVKKYEEKYGKKPDQFAAQAYDGMYIMAQSLLKTNKGGDRNALRDELAQLKDFNGVSGKLSFDEKRNPIGVPVVVTVKAGKFVTFE
ncbi:MULTISPECIES: ABC transporter substrate-binding protein [Paenibacillus]|uniref:Receptor family ligand binding region n=2 Tax=Bacteria TaxID=2 RepID=A0A0U2WA43_9BACL|nr:receptor family ligand binding region [Paenibacillus naphthalenovorans]NTZ20419.1 branched-chain amino acid ABC transporter substrate-binding protein [Paenibacillus sp. JMULE4]GCL73792.1 branched-chain amino acid ABC transporter substrate-binding protein [Paenibacillus naphthalenovorans]SDI53629.1 branched-chain amino acid transport system substrate-binding protein [Paenibacillus naphthalenovorans]